MAEKRPTSRPQEIWLGMIQLMKAVTFVLHNSSYPPNRQMPPRDNDFRVTVMKVSKLRLFHG